MITLIAAVAQNRVIGNGPQIPWRVPGEQEHFRDTTMGHAVIMGRATFDSIGRGLPGRRVIVVTRAPIVSHPDVETASSLDDAIALAGAGTEIFIAGGGQLYEAAMPYADRLILSEIPLAPDGDVLFPEFTLFDGRDLPTSPILDAWVETSRADHWSFQVVTYARPVPVHDPDAPVLVAGDWHGEVRLAMAAVRAAKERGIELILHTGDFGIWRGDEFFLDALQRELEAAGVQLWFVDGNHEDFERLYAYAPDPDGRRRVRRSVWHLSRGHRFAAAGRSWLACGGAASIDRSFRTPMLNWWPQEMITQADLNRCAIGGRVDALLIHEAPDESPTLRAAYASPSQWPESGLAESEQSRRMISALVEATGPRFLFHGHHHLRYVDVLVELTITGLGTLPSDNLAVFDGETVELLGP